DVVEVPWLRSRVSGAFGALQGLVRYVALAPRDGPERLGRRGSQAYEVIAAVRGGAEHRVRALELAQGGLERGAVELGAVGAHDHGAVARRCRRGRERMRQARAQIASDLQPLAPGAAPEARP